MNIRDLFFFDSMLTPKIIIFIYWIMLVGAVGSGIAMMAGVSFLGGLGSMIGGAIGARIFCELMIVAFKINEALQEIRLK
jgi:hypothetical protein